jgi:hypothetical protein
VGSGGAESPRKQCGKHSFGHRRSHDRGIRHFEPGTFGSINSASAQKPQIPLGDALGRRGPLDFSAKIAGVILPVI